MELFPASQIAERLGNNDRLMEMILERNNIIRAWKQVCANKGAPGVDGMKTSQLGNYLAKYWPEIEQDLLNCKHKPLPVKRNEIPKPDGGVRLLGIPTVLDRFIQQAIAQILEQVWEPFFSEYSYGFRPGKSAHDAVVQGKELNQYFRGWWNYFRLTEAQSFLKGLKIWIMRRLRSLVWKQWKNPKTRVRNLEKLGIAHHDAMLCGNARKKYRHMSKIKWVAIAMPEKYFIEKGLYLPGN